MGNRYIAFGGGYGEGYRVYIPMAVYADASDVAEDTSNFFPLSIRATETADLANSGLIPVWYSRECSYVSGVVDHFPEEQYPLPVSMDGGFIIPKEYHQAIIQIVQKYGTARRTFRL